MQNPVVVVLLAGAALGVLPAAAGAQTGGRFYAGAAMGSINVSADEVDGTSSAAGGIFGFRALPWLDVEAEISRPANSFTRSYGGSDELSMSFAPPGATREELERAGIWLRYDRRRDISVTLSAAAILRPSSRGRFVPGLVVGVTNHTVRNRTDYTPVRIGPDVDPSNRHARPYTESGTRNVGGLTVGGNVVVTITRHLGVVPDLRYDYGSIGDEKERSLRSSVRVVWTF
jgi:hypothetical protein